MIIFGVGKTYGKRNQCYVSISCSYYDNGGKGDEMVLLREMLLNWPGIIAVDGDMPLPVHLIIAKKKFRLANYV